MPELPEVETTVRGMNETIRGLVIGDIWCDWDKLLRDTTIKELRKLVVGNTITQVQRRGKNILATVSNGHTLIMHMKMTGHFMYGSYVYDKKQNTWEPQDKSSALADPFNRFVHIVFSFENKKQLVFCDMRKFGKIEITKSDDVYQHPRLSGIGPEPLEAEFTQDVFEQQIQQKQKSKIKQVLLDQSIIAGIGNIYADESLHLADIHPERVVSSLNSSELKKLYKAIKISLNKGLTLGGDSTSDYRNIYGEKGLSQNTHAVYRQTGKQCTKKRCDGTIIRIVVAARGTHFCNICQI
jgi:formamidopyrimidine-DNA glycosylase